MGENRIGMLKNCITAEVAYFVNKQHSNITEKATAQSKLCAAHCDNAKLQCAAFKLSHGHNSHMISS
jgi:hypothetical protein